MLRILLKPVSLFLDMTMKYIILGILIVIFLDHFQLVNGTQLLTDVFFILWEKFMGWIDQLFNAVVEAIVWENVTDLIDSIKDWLGGFL